MPWDIYLPNDIECDGIFCFNGSTVFVMFSGGFRSEFDSSRYHTNGDFTPSKLGRLPSGSLT